MKLRNTLVAIAAFGCLGLLAQTAAAQSNGSLENNLFSQYYTRGAGPTAALYTAPHPVPRNVGHTYFTYQPLMPHEMLYAHQRNYLNYYGDGDYYTPNFGLHGSNGSLTRTTVVWQNGSNHLAPLGLNGPLGNFQWGWQKYLNNGGPGSHLRGKIGRLQGAFGGGIGGGCATGGCGY